MTDREIKALQIAAKSKLTRKGNTWLVPSQAGHGEYKVNPDPEAPHCTCPDQVRLDPFALIRHKRAAITRIVPQSEPRC
jgi:hypothetical protein